MTRDDLWHFRLHPLVSSFEAATIFNKLRRDFVENNLLPWENNEPPKLSPNARRDLIDKARELAQIELGNAFKRILGLG